MYEMAEFLYLHEMVHFHCSCVAYAVYIVSRKVDKHDVFGAIFLGSLEFVS